MPEPAFAETIAAEAAAPARRAIPPSLSARYEDLAFLGEGGMGVVYRGFDPRLGRAVALKLIKGDDPAVWRRFIQEARAQARVVHDNVCRVYEAGQADGEPYVAMQLIEGEPLSRLGPTLRLEESVKLLRMVASAVHEAHRQGLIHRDLKPQNILVETAADGSLKPYVVDFGLAREVAERGQTVTGAVLGTPAYMPPEQALGDVRAMDRRSDVYALGATLYELVAGRTPFVSDNPWKLLMKVAYEDAPSLSGLKKGVAPDLETIVMKCLERDPARRYDSARALGDDLQRFLDGDPIEARRASFAYVALKRARKHKLAAALGAVALAAAVSLGAVWIKARRDLAEGARLSQALGEDVKGMELFLRNAYGMPLHDVERERAVVRARLQAIEARTRAAGKVGEGPGHYAMGRGHLALGDAAAAREHLERARAAGYLSAALDVALGRALGELFRRASEETKRITNEEERKKRLAALARELRDPALAHLRAAVGAEVETPAYAEGLIALYEGRNEEALAKAREAFAAAPWLYEAKKLEGDARYAMGTPFRHDAAFDYDKMMAHFRPAAEAYREAADIARSDPAVHRAECELWEKIGWAEATRDSDPGAVLDIADRACDRAAQSSSLDARARVQRAMALSVRVSYLAARPREEAVAVADRAVRAAEEAAHAAPGDVMALYTVALGLMLQAMLLEGLGREASAEPALVAYRRVLEVDPQFMWAICELGEVYLLAASIERRRGRDTQEPLRAALEQYDRASTLDPAYSMPAQKRIKVYVDMLEDAIEHGRSTEAMVADAMTAVTTFAARVGPASFLVALWKAYALRLRALHEMSIGGDPRPHTRAAMEAIAALPEGSRNSGWLLLEVAACQWVNARHALPKAGAFIEEARATVREGAATGVPDLKSWSLLAAQIEMVAAIEATTRGDAGPDVFEAAMSPLRPLLAKGGTDARPYQLMAEAHARRAAWASKHHRDAREDLEAGGALVKQALARNPHLADAHVASGLLALAEARAARDPGLREAAARRGKAAFDLAFQNNPRLAREHRDEIAELVTMAP